MKVSEILIEAKAGIEDEEKWNKGGWASPSYIDSEHDLLAADKVCAVTSVARVCLKRGEVEIKWTHLEEKDHDCGCEHCTTYSVEVEVERNLDDVMEDFEHPAKSYLDRAAEELYSDQANYIVSVVDVNDGKDYTHADVMRVYDRAIEMAKEDEAA